MESSRVVGTKLSFSYTKKRLVAHLKRLPILNRNAFNEHSHSVGSNQFDAFKAKKNQNKTVAVFTLLHCLVDNVYLSFGCCTTSRLNDGLLIGLLDYAGVG